MTNITLAEYILRYNSDTLPDVKMSEQITNCVILKLVLGLPTPARSNPKSYNSIYFILETESRKCISVVYIMEENLHVFTSPNYRKKGFIKNAMVDAIFPNLFKHNDSIEISLLNDEESDYNISIKVAESLGFQKIESDEDKFVLWKKDFEVEIFKY